VERVLTDINADYGNRTLCCRSHGVLLVLVPLASLSLAEQEHGRTIPLAVLDVSFGGRPQVHARVGIDEGEILPLDGREAGSVSARHLIHLSIRLRLQTGGGDEYTLSCDLDPVRAR
jgi:hypothetical protein